MDALSAMVASMIALSVGVERIVEILKGMYPPLAKGKDVWIHLVSTAAGTGVAFAIGPHNLVSNLPPPVGGDWLIQLWCSLLLGLMASGGSAFWNHLLDILGAVKTVREQEANKVKAAEAGPAPAVAPNASG